MSNQPLAPISQALLVTMEAELDQRLRPAEPVAVVARLARLANHFNRERKPEEWDMLFEDYGKRLAGISLPHLRQIIDAALSENPWLPKIADLVRHWEPLRYLEQELLRRTRVLLGKEEAKPWERATSLPSDSKSGPYAGERDQPRTRQLQKAFDSLRPSLVSSARNGGGR